MGLRRNVLTDIKDVINELTIDSLGLTIKAQNALFDPFEEIAELPKFAVVPAPHSIRVGLYGFLKDSTMRVDLHGYAMATFDNEQFLVGEDIIQGVVDKLTSTASADKFKTTGFSITDIGPLIDEQFASKSDFIFMFIPLSIVFIEP